MTALRKVSYDLPVVNHALLKQIGFGKLSTRCSIHGVARSIWARPSAIATHKSALWRQAQSRCDGLRVDIDRTVFSHVTYKKLAGGGFMKLVNPMLEAGLERLGYSSDEVADIVAYIMREENGMIVDGKIEGAPHLREEDLAVFDTANRCGTGERYISRHGHVRMVAAISPMISGAISKTVNLPKEATVDDFKDVLMTSWKLGVKGITLYRDGSKFAQPLNITLKQRNIADIPLDELLYSELLALAREQQSEIESLRSLKRAARAETKALAASRREKPIGIRTGRTHPAQIEDVKIYTTVNRNEDNEITEIYITTDREGTLIMGLLNSLSKTISVMLQYRIPPQDIAKMLRGQKYEPYGFVQRHPNIKYCTSISDLISKIIDMEIGDYRVCK